MRRRAGEERASRLRLEVCVGSALCGAKRGAAEARKHERMVGNVNDRTEEVLLELVPLGDEGLEDIPVRVAVRAEVSSCVVERAPYEHGRPGVQRMRER